MSVSGWMGTLQNTCWLSIPPVDYYVSTYVITYMNTLFEQAGVLALGSRIRAIGERLAEDGRHVYREHGLDLDASWFPVFYHLRHTSEASVSDVATAIGRTHASVSQISRAMQRKGILASRPSPDDGRVRLLSLSGQGRTMVPTFDAICRDVGHAAEEMVAEMTTDLWNALSELEHVLDREAFNIRVQRQRKMRLASQTTIRPVVRESADIDAFVALNRDWIQEYFRMEAADERMFANVESDILDTGGQIFVAELEGRIVGACALVHHGDGVFELAKMAVEREARGRKIGWLLGQRVIDAARDLDGHMVFIESNTRLGPAIQLYYKLGFRKVAGHVSPYERSNIYMELSLRTASSP